MKITVSNRNAADRVSCPYLGREKDDDGCLVLVLNHAHFVLLTGDRGPYPVRSFGGCDAEKESALIERLPPGYAVTLIQD